MLYFAKNFVLRAKLCSKSYPPSLGRAGRQWDVYRLCWLCLAMCEAGTLQSTMQFVSFEADISTIGDYF